MQFKHIGVFVGLSAVVATATSADWGIAVGVANNTQVLYAPIQVAPGWRVEPFFGHSKTDTVRDVSIYSDAKNAYSDWTLGAGVFGVRPASPQVNLLGGLRLAYLKSTQDNGFFGGTERKGYALAPTVGFEYFIEKHIAVGAEASFNVSRVKEKRMSYSETTEGTIRARSTSSLVTLKYFFN